MKHESARAIILISALLLAGCEKSTSSPRDVPLPTAKALNAPASPMGESANSGDPAGTTERNFSGAVFQVPNSWREKPLASDMINADFRLGAPDAEARLTLSSAQGGVAANVDRWKGQFARGKDDPSPKESRLQVSGKEATLVELFGSYQGMEPGATRKTGQAMLGAVIPLQVDGRETCYFVKLTGPRQTVIDAREDFVKFVETAKFKE